MCVHPVIVIVTHQGLGPTRIRLEVKDEGSEVRGYDWALISAHLTIFNS